MATYDLIKELEALKSFPKLVKRGIIPVNWIDYKVIYEFYLLELEKLKTDGVIKHGDKRQAKENTAEEYGISERTVYLIAKKMSEK